MAVIDIHGQKFTGKEAMNLLAVVKEAINLLAHPVHWTMEKADIVTAIVNVTEETTNLLAQPVRRSAQNQEARPQIAGKNTDKGYLRGLAKRMADEGLLGQLKQTPRKTRPSRAQGQGEKRESCMHCGKSHAGECWYKPGVVVAKLSIAYSTRHAYPDTQAEVSVTNDPEHVVRTLPNKVKLQGLLGKPQLAQSADLAFRFKTDKGRLLTLRLRKPGLYLPAAKEILLAHQDLEDAGFRVNYHTGKMRAPGGHVRTMTKSGAVWKSPVTPLRTRATKHKHNALTVTTAP